MGMRQTRTIVKKLLHNRMALTGIVMIVFFVLIAVFAPLLTNVNPIYDTALASPYSVPQWATIFPLYSNLPVDTQYFPEGDFKTSSAVSLWSYSPQNVTNSSGLVYAYSWNNAVGPSKVSAEHYDVANTGPGSLSIEVNGPVGNYQPTFTLSRSFLYTYKPPQRFRLGFFATTNSSAPLNLIVNIIVSNGTKQYTIMSQGLYQLQNDSWTHVIADSSGSDMGSLIIPNNPLGNVAKIVMQSKGEYNVSISMTVSGAQGSSVSIYLSDAMFYVFGSAYSILGTDDQGRSVWSQFVYGSRISLEIGFFAAAICIVLATIIGIVSGYYGGWMDEILMRFNDFLLTIPLLPLLLVLILIVDVSGVPIDLEVLVVLLIGLLGWEVYARIIRSQVLSVRERTFVTAARTLGVRPRTIIRRHILANVTGLIYALLSQAVPTAILLEASLSFLGFFDPNVISWGRMLGAAQSVALSSVHGFVWWWFLPPGIAIALVSVSFIFLGNALDELFNPKIIR